MKKTLSLILALILTLSLLPSAFAASDEAQQAAQNLYELRLFQGTGTDANGNPNFDLDRTPTRAEAVTMLVRLLGKDEEVKYGAWGGAWKTPFTDVADWSRFYISYAYANGLTTGTSATTFGGNGTVTATQYITFVLRALGYQSGTDFQWDKAWELSDKIGLTNGEYNANTTNFTRGDVAIISNNALQTNSKGSNITLFEQLNNDGFGTVIYTDNVINNNEVEFFLENGQYYSGAGLGRYEIYEINWNDKAELFVSVRWLNYFFSIISNSHIIDYDMDDNPFVAGYIQLTTSTKNGYSYEHYEEYVNISTCIEYEKFCLNGIELALPYAGEPHDLSVLYYFDGIRCFNSTTFRGDILVSVSDVFEKFGIKGAIEITQIDEDAFAWSYVK